MTVLCSWCGAQKRRCHLTNTHKWYRISTKQRAKIELNHDVSHGICPSCADWMRWELILNRAQFATSADADLIAQRIAN